MKKIWLLNLLPAVISIIHTAHTLPEPFDNIVFSMLVNLNYLSYFASGLYYFFINYCLCGESKKKTFLFSLLGLSIWWSIDLIMYFVVGDVDDVGAFLIKAFAVYNYVLLLMSWGVSYLIRRAKKQV